MHTTTIKKYDGLLCFYKKNYLLSYLNGADLCAQECTIFVTDQRILDIWPLALSFRKKINFRSRFYYNLYQAGWMPKVPPQNEKSFSGKRSSIHIYKIFFKTRKITNPINVTFFESFLKILIRIIGAGVSLFKILLLINGY